MVKSNSYATLETLRHEDTRLKNSIEQPLTLEESFGSIENECNESQFFCQNHGLMKKGRYANTNATVQDNEDTAGWW
jgi:hypothetical protein